MSLEQTDLMAIRAATLCGSGPKPCLRVLFAELFAGAFARQCLLQTGFCARLQIVGVTLHFLNDFVLLHFALKATQGVVHRLFLLQSNFRQTLTPNPLLLEPKATHRP